ncbi:MAG TPA: hypothetical protein VGG65_10225 [Thermoanaerobaculia bacterium]
MIPRSPLARLVALAGAALLADRLTATAQGAFSSVPSGGPARPGSEVLLSWTLDASAAPDADEAELVLSLDGGESFTVRVTGRIAPGTSSVAWRVPSLPTQHARLALRAGHDETAEAEQILFVSEPFEIGAAPAGPLEDLYAVGDEWRTREALEGAPVRTLPRQIESGPSDGDVAETDHEIKDSETAPATDAPVPDAAPRPHSAPPRRAHKTSASDQPARAPLPLRL